MIARWRRWLGLAPGKPRERDRREDGNVFTSRPPAAGDGADHAPIEPPDRHAIGRLYCRGLFSRAAGDSGPAPGEKEWLRARRDQLKQGDTALAALVPRLPAAMPRLMAATREPERTSARELAGLIESDPVLAANVLKVVNSPAMRIRREDVESLEQAVVIMGFPGMREVLAAATISPIANFDGDARLDATALRQVWPHTLDVAVAVRQAATRMGSGHGFELYLAALAHSSGLMVLLRCLNTLKEPIPSETFIAELDPLAQRLSVAIARGWEFPDETVQTLERRAREAHGYPEAEMLTQAITFVRARALGLAGILDDGQVAMIRRQLPDYARDWHGEGEHHGSRPVSGGLPLRAE
jgi:HD-like signal output (HDOD) protein